MTDPALRGMVSGQDVLPGVVLGADKKALYVRTADGVLALLEVQLEGKKRLTADAFLRGTRIPAGIVLGTKA